jgi:type IV pilus assembly protein PilN
MIRINLLPLRAERKKEDARRIVSVYVLSVALVLLAMGSWHLTGMRKVSRLDAQVATNKKEIAHFTKLAEKIKVFQEQKAALEAKLGVIQSLEKSKSGPVHLLDEVASRLPAQRLWLTSLEQVSQTLTLKGEALDNESIAVYMRQLAGSNYIKNVDLLGAEQKEREDGTKVMEFSIVCNISLTGESETAPAAPGQAKPNQRIAQR